LALSVCSDTHAPPQDPWPAEQEPVFAPAIPAAPAGALPAAPGVPAEPVPAAAPAEVPAENAPLTPAVGTRPAVPEAPPKDEPPTPTGAPLVPAEGATPSSSRVLSQPPPKRTVTVRTITGTRSLRTNRWGVRRSIMVDSRSPLLLASAGANFRHQKTPATRGGHALLKTAHCAVIAHHNVRKRRTCPLRMSHSWGRSQSRREDLSGSRRRSVRPNTECKRSAILRDECDAHVVHRRMDASGEQFPCSSTGLRRAFAMRTPRMSL
jgi:hypothetical protein